MDKLALVFLYAILISVVIGVFLHYAKPWLQGQRTRIAQSVVGVIGILEAADLSFITDEWRPVVYLVIALVGLWLRQITTTPPGEKELDQ